MQAEIRETTIGLADQAYRRLRTTLIEGAFAPGERLSIRRVATALDTGAMPARTALQRLAAEQALDMLPSGTAMVPRLGRDAFVSLSAIRAELEPLAIRMAAPRMAKSTQKQLNALVTQQEDAFRRQDPEATLRADRLFLFTIYREAGSPILLQFIESLWLRRGPLFWDARWVLQSRPDQRHRHAEIVAALRQRNAAAAAAALRSEIEEATAYLLAHYYDAPAHRAAAR